MEVDFRDAHGFAVPPQYLQKYGEFARIYKEEEKEKSQRWKAFLEKLAESKVNLREESGLTAPEFVLGGDGHSANVEKTSDLEKRLTIGDDIQENLSKDDDPEEILKRWNEVENDESLQERILIKESDQTKLNIFQDSTTLLNSSEPTIPCLRPCKDFIWADINPSLSGIEQIMSQRVKREVLVDTQQSIESSNCLNPMDEATPMKGFLGEYSEEKIDWVDIVKRVPPNYDESANMAINHTSKEFTFPLKVVECLVRDGVPMCLRGELWQAFVGVRARKVDGYYQKLVNLGVSCGGLISSEAQKWKWQIEKDLPRTFPGHPALDEDGRNALRRLLTAYAQHNPLVGYCQAMNFFAGLLLMLMPEENAFWTLLGIIDDYFEGYYTEEMIEAQVDQLVLEGIIRERFPKLVHHLDFLGVQVAWITGPWFLSIFLNIVPWETALRVWDALLFYGNRVMLFHTALALLELHGSELVAVKDAGDAVTLLKSLVGSTFDSSQLVLTACMGYQTVNEVKLQELRKKYRADVVKDMAERSIGPKHSISLATQLYSFKHDPDALLLGAKLTEASHDRHINESKTSKLKLFSNGDADLDLTEQVTRLKVKLCKILGEKRSENIRAEQLETAFMEMIKQDNRRILIAKVEHLEKEEYELKLALISKQEQEHDMIKALVNLEQEQKVVEDARLSAEQAGAAQKCADSILKEKYEAAMVDLAEKEKRALMAETLLEATVQYQSGQVKVQLKTPQPLRTRKISEDSVAQRGLLSRPYGWFDKTKGKPNDAEQPNDP